jgi:hypothetical protein
VFSGSYRISYAYVIPCITGLLGIIFLSLLFADDISCGMTECAEYIFSRETDRIRWFRKKLGGLLGYCSLGVFLYSIFYIWEGIHRSVYGIRKEDIMLILCAYIMLVMFTYSSILSINLLSLRYSVTIGFVIFYAAVLLSTMIVTWIQGIPNQVLAGILHRINPMSNILVSWNYGYFYVIWAIGYYALLNFVLAVLLWSKVKNYEFIGSIRR